MDTAIKAFTIQGDEHHSYKVTHALRWPLNAALPGINLPAGGSYVVFSTTDTSNITLGFEGSLPIIMVMQSAHYEEVFPKGGLTRLFRLPSQLPEASKDIKPSGESLVPLGKSLVDLGAGIRAHRTPTGPTNVEPYPCLKMESPVFDEGVFDKVNTVVASAVAQLQKNIDSQVALEIEARDVVAAGPIGKQFVEMCRTMGELEPEAAAAKAFVALKRMGLINFVA